MIYLCIWKDAILKAMINLVIDFELAQWCFLTASDYTNPKKTKDLWEALGLRFFLMRGTIVGISCACLAVFVIVMAVALGRRWCFFVQGRCFRSLSGHIFVSILIVICLFHFFSWLWFDLMFGVFCFNVCLHCCHFLYIVDCFFGAAHWSQKGPTGARVN